MTNFSIQSFYKQIRIFFHSSWLILALVYILLILGFGFILNSNLKKQVDNIVWRINEKINIAKNLTLENKDNSKLVKSHLGINKKGTIVESTPGWLRGINVSKSKLIKRNEHLKEGEFNIFFNPDLSDMIWRVFFVIKKDDLFKISVFNSADFFDLKQKGNQILILDRNSIISYSNRHELVGNIFTATGLTFENGKVILVDSRAITGNRHLNLIVKYNVTMEFFLILILLIIMLCSFFFLHLRTKILDKTLGQLQKEATDISRLIKKFSQVTKNKDHSFIENFDLFNKTILPPLQEISQLKPSFKENEDFIELIKYFANSTDELFKQIKKDAQIHLDSKERMELALKGAKLGWWDWNLKTDAVYYSERWAQMLGYDLSEIVPHKKTLDDLIFPADKARLEQEIQNHLTDKTEFLAVEFRLISKNGNLKWVLSRGKIVERLPDGTPLRIAGTHLDITKTKENEEERNILFEALKFKNDELERSENYIKSIIDSMPSVMIGLNKKLDINNWNKSAEKLTGYKRLDVLDEPLENILPELSTLVGVIKESLEKGTPVKIAKQKRRRGGELYYEDIMIYPLESVDGAVIRLDDVTDRVKMEEIMVQTEKMMSVGGLAAGMAHEINNPLEIIVHGIQNAERRLSSQLPANIKAAEECGTDINTVREYLSKRQIFKYLEGIKKAADRSAKIVSNMLNFSRGSNSIKDSIFINQLLDNSIELATKDYDLKRKYDFKHINIIREYCAEKSKVYCIKTEIEQVILNLLRNAAQAMSNKDFGDTQAMIKIKTDIKDKKAIIKISDNGPGMSEKIKKRIFEPFFTTKQVGVGTGLGLSVSYFIITQNHGGSMNVESIPEKGTIFTIELPVSEKIQN